MTTVGAEPLRRLHPLSPVLHGFKTLAVIIAALSVQGAFRLGWRGFIGTLLVVMCLAVAVSVVSWLVTGYQVVGRELRVREGLLVRRTRAIPLERLQAVEVVRPLLARLTGLAELRLEVVGGGNTEAPLAYLTVVDAARLRHRLLALAGRPGAPDASVEQAEMTGPDLAGPVPLAPAERHLHSVVNRDVLVSQLLTPQVMFLPIAILMVVAQYWLGTALSFVAFASMVVAIIGVIQQPARRITSDWNFRLRTADAALRISHGLTELRNQTVPLHRVQGIGVTWPRLWRGRQWLRCQVDVAGYGLMQAGTSDRLLPVGDLATAGKLMDEVLPGVDLTQLPLVTAPVRARWIAPLDQPVLAVGLTDQVFATQQGRITRQLVLVPYPRIQSVRLVQGPLQRLLGLATVRVDTAGSLTAAASGRDLAEARWLAAELSVRAHAARDADRVAGPPATGGGGGEATTN